MDAASLRARTLAALEHARANVESFLALPADTPLAAAVLAFDRLLEPLNGVAGMVSAGVNLHPDPEVRSTAEELEQEVARLRTALALDRRVYERLAALDPAAAPTPEARRLLEHALRDMRRAGVDRDPEVRERIRALQEELVRTGQEFDRNIVEDRRTFVIDDGPAGLEGCPQDFVDAHPPRADGAVELSLDPVDRIPFLSYARRADLRRAYFELSHDRAYPRNVQVLERLLALRHELAGLLGHRHWADFVTEDKMSRSARAVRGFLERVVALVRGRAQAEADELLAAKRRHEPGAREVFEEERLFLTERVKRERFGFDSQAVRPYFPYARVKEGVLATSAELYGVEFVPRPDVVTWHPSVETYDLREGGAVRARFHLDMHPRDGKYRHAALFHLADGVDGGELPAAALVCNFPQPRPGDPALLEHDQVTTLFHEFGHLLHHLFAGRQPYLAFSGIATEHDFCEVPSQMYEEWAWDPGVLARFARHVTSGEPIPAELVRSLRAAEEYGKGLQVLVQMTYALLSLTYHDRDPAGLDLTATLHALQRELLPLTPRGTHFHASFGHLHGYSAMYYTYMWSLVIAKDLWSRFRGDPMDGATAAEYRRAVLEPGGSRDGAELVRRFLGRDYGFEAFEAWLASA